VLEGALEELRLPSCRLQDVRPIARRELEILVRLGELGRRES
jgi:hypothetical protein